jgi:hypothetical protein
MKRYEWVSSAAVVALTMGALAMTVMPLRQSEVMEAQATQGFSAMQPGRGERGDGRDGRGDRPDFHNMTPQQRDQMMRQFADRMVRDNLSRHGVTDKATQDAVVNFATAQMSQRRAIGDKTRELREAIDGKQSDAQIAAKLNSLRVAINAAKQNRAKSLKALNAKIGYSKKPRLDAILLLSGVTDDSGLVMGGRGFGRRGPGGPGGPRGEGRGPGGPGGFGGPRGGR